MSDDAIDANVKHPSSLSELGRRVSAVLDLFDSRTKAAKVAGRSTDMLGKYEKGTSEPPFTALANLCLAVGVRMEWLATGEGEMRAGAPKPAPQQTSQPVRRDATTMGLGMLTKAVRLVGDALDKYQLRDLVDAETFAALVEDTFRELQLGKAEDIVQEMLDRVVGIARNPRQD